MPNVQLHCPSTGATVDHVIGAHQTPASVAQAVRIKLGIKFAALFTVDAKPIADTKSLEEGTRVLVAANELEKMLPESPNEYKLYQGEEKEDMDQDVDVYGQDWEDLDEQEKCLHVISVNEHKPETRNTLRITRPYKMVHAEISAIGASSSSSSSSPDPEDLIEKRWGISVENFLPINMKPNKFASVSRSLDPQVLAAIAVYSSFTQGQSRLAREVLEEGVALRANADQQDEDDKDPVVRKQDVMVAIEIIYERAGVNAAKITKVKSETAKGKEKARAAKDKKKAAGKGKKKEEEGQQGPQTGEAA